MNEQIYDLAGAKEPPCPKPKAKKRLDFILFEQGFFETKSKAAANILAGNVKINDTVISKAGTLYYQTQFEGENALEIQVKSLPFVSRGGLKLQGALNEFKINLKGKTCIDIGASTGGFTDCMLQAGAIKVFAVDVGHNQLDWKIRQDGRTVVLEKINAKNCTFKDIFGVEKEEYSEELPQFLSMDLSFISIKKVLENVLNFVSKNCEMVLLIKPQFEAGKEDIQKGGVVRETKIHNEIIEDIKNFASNIGLTTIGVINSPILGNKSGNVEFLIYLNRNE